MKTERRIAPRNSLLFVVSSRDPEIPESVGVGLVAATNTCVGVGTLAEDDGETDVVLTDEPISENGLTAVYDGVLDNRDGHIAVETVLGERILSEERSAGRQSLTIWVNHPTEPDKIFVQLHP